MAKNVITKEQLIEAYLELDEVVGIEPPIEYEEMGLNALAKEVHETVVALVEPEDEFTAKTQKVFDLLAEMYDEDDDDEEPEEDDEQEDEDEDDDDEEVFEEEEDDEPEDRPEPKVDEPEETASLIDRLKPIRKKVELHALLDEPEFKKVKDAFLTENNPIKLKKRMTDYLQQEPVEEKPKSEKPAKKVSAKPKAEKPKAKDGKRATMKERIAFIEELIKSGKKLTRKEIVDELDVNFPFNSRASHQTIITDGKNPNIGRFSHLLVEDKSGILSFGKKMAK